MRALVTGGAGFIGQHTVRALLKRGWKVSVLDARTSVATGWEYLQDVIPDGLHRGSILAPYQVVEALESQRFDVCLHLAAQSHVDESLLDPKGTVEVNVIGTQIVAEECASRHIPLLYCSTDEVYGDSADGLGRNFELCQLPMSWERDELRPSSPYSASKAAGELIVRAIARSYSLEYAITRGTNAFGPGQYPQKLIPIVCRMLQRGEPVPMHDGGLQVRQWVHVEEFATMLCLVAKGLVSEPKKTSGQTYNIAGPERVSVLDLTEMFAEVLGVPKNKAWVDAPGRPGGDRAYSVSGEKAASDLGFYAKRCISSRSEIEELLKAYPAEGHCEITTYGGES